MEHTLRDIMQVMETWAPPGWAESYDNVGLMWGDPTKAVRTVLTALEVTASVAAEALAQQVDAVVVHHPPIFFPLKQLDLSYVPHLRIARLVGAGIAVYAAHTNLDQAIGATNDLLAAAFGLQAPAVLMPRGVVAPDSPRGYGRVGNLATPLTVGELAARTKQVLGVDFVRVVGNLDAQVTRLAVSAGEANDVITPAGRLGAQALIGGDFKYHFAREAEDIGLALIDPGHFSTENGVKAAIAARLQQELPGLDVRIAQSAKEPFFVR